MRRMYLHIGKEGVQPPKKTKDKWVPISRYLHHLRQLWFHLPGLSPAEQDAIFQRFDAVGQRSSRALTLREKCHQRLLLRTVVALFLGPNSGKQFKEALFSDSKF